MRGGRRGAVPLLLLAAFVMWGCARADGPDGAKDGGVGKDGSADRDQAAPFFGDLAGADLTGVDLTGFDPPDLAPAPDMAHTVTGLPTAGSWTPLPSPSALVTPQTSYVQQRLILHGDKPTLTWIDGKDVRVAQYDGAAWKLVGGAINGVPGYNASTPQLASNGGRLYLAFLERISAANASPAAWVFYWDGTSWIPVGAPVPNPGSGLSFAVSSTLTPYVSWTAKPVDPGPSQVYVLRYDGASWTQYGPSFAAEGTSSSALAAKVAMGSNDKLYVSWQESWVHVYLNGGSWSALGPNNAKMTDGTGTSTYTQELTVDHQDRPVAGWLELTSGAGGDASIDIARWNGTSWDLLTPTPLSVAPGLSPAMLSSITVDGLNAPIVTWTEDVGTPKVNTLYVKRIASAGVSAFVGQPLVVPTGYQYLSVPQVVVDSYDVATLVFSAQKISGGAYELFVYRFSPS